jgi:hypothetical protein
MPRWHPKNCRKCGRHESEVGPISAAGWCAEHGKERQDANYDSLRARQGAFYEHMLRRRVMGAYKRLVALERGEA